MRLIRFSWLIVVALLFWAAAQDEASAQAKKSAPSKQPAAKSQAPAAKSGVKSGTKAVAVKGKAPVRNQYKRSTSIRRTYGTGKAPASRRVAMKARSKAPAPRRVFYNPGQQAPSTDRYVEIERALVDRGYLQKDPDGKWDQRSADALKQFQTEHNLRADGKLSSMALIALGLGPKHTPAGAVTPTNPQAPKPAIAPAAAPVPEPAASNEGSNSPR